MYGRRGWRNGGRRTVGVEQLYSGSALGAVGTDGKVPLPPFIRRVIGSSSAGVVTLGAHESDPCLTAYEPGHAPVLQAELERRRLRDEAAGAGTDKHHMRARRAFGFVEDAEVEGDRLALPPMMRMRGRIGELVLFVGTGATFEIWNPEVALEEGDEGLRELAGYRLGQRNTPGREKAR